MIKVAAATCGHGGDNLDNSNSGHHQSSKSISQLSIVATKIDVVTISHHHLRTYTPLPQLTLYLSLSTYKHTHHPSFPVLQVNVKLLSSPWPVTTREMEINLRKNKESPNLRGTRAYIDMKRITRQTHESDIHPSDSEHKQEALKEPTDS